MKVEPARIGRQRPRSFSTTLAVVLALTLLLADKPVSGQAAYGVIRGTVVDSSGLPVPAARVKISNQTTRESRPAATNQSGDFVFPSLLPGLYTVTIEAAGF